MRLSKTVTLALAALVAVAGPATTASAAVEDGVRDTDAPAVVRIGAPAQVVPITVVSDVPAEAYEALVATPGDGEGFGYGVVEGGEPGRPNVFKVPVGILAEDIPSWGAKTWYIRGYDVVGDTEVEVVAETTRPVDVRANSLLGLSLKRYGDKVGVTASARAFHNVQGRYVAYSNRDVSVQAWTGTAWKQVVGLTTDVRGNQTTFPVVPRGTAMRLVLRDAPTVWGAVSATQTI